jgi:serine protease inhibitor
MNKKNTNSKNMKRTLTLFVLITLGLFSCNKDDSDIKDLNIDFKSEKLIKADNEFGLDLFKGVYNDSKTPVNFMISPLSVSVALSMAYNGAETETKTEMEEALRIKGFSRDEINKAYKELITALTTADPKVTMEIANSIWYSDIYHVEQSFLDVNKTYYDAEVESADFSDLNTVNLINNWVSEKTHEKIPEIIDEISPDMVMFLINAIYFNGIWTKEFNPESTQKLPFKTESGNYKSTSMMGRKDSLNYFSNETFSAIEMPYGQGNYNMMILLPNEDKTVSEIIGQLNPENWEKWQKALKFKNSIDIRLPRFKIEFDIKLNEILKAMGMQLAFTDMADFSGINPARDLFISYVKHKTFVEVDEEGTEAAAVTIIGFETTSAQPGEVQWIPFHCYSPFLFAITEKDTGAILFMGKVGDPTKK